MSKVPIEFEKITTNVALGSVFALGVFFCVDSINGSFLKEFEIYARMDSFGVIAVIPILAILYLIGAFISLTSDMVFQFFNPKGFDTEWELLGEVVRCDSDIMASKFNELYVQKKILEGSVLPFLVLAAGIYLERSNLPNLEAELLAVSLSLVCLAIVTPFYATRIQKRMESLIGMYHKYLMP